MFAGDTAFKLYDTYGFPLDLTQDALKPRGIAVDTDGFDAAMEKQKEEARKAWKGSGEAATEAVWFEVKEQGRRHRLPRLRHGERPRARSAPSSRTARRPSSLKAGDEGALVLNQTPFYGESGGQVGDEGVIKGPKGALFRVTDTQKKLGDVFVHIGRVEKGAFKPGDAVELAVDHARRTAIARQPLRHPSAARGAAPGAGHARGAEGLAGGARPPALRLLAHQADERPRRSPPSRRWPTPIVLQNCAGRDAPDGASRTPCRAAPWRCSARSTATRCASSPWAWATSGAKGQQGLVGRAVRRHARAAHRRHRPRQDRRRERERRRRAPHRGADRAKARAPIWPSRTAACASSRASCAPSPTTWSSA